MSTETTETTETASDILAAVLAAYPYASDARRETLTLAAQAGADQPTLITIASALRVNRRDTMLLPAHRYEGLSRGRGWCRCGQGDAVAWGERVGRKYRVGPGEWIVYGSDGFDREGRDAWKVATVRVAGEDWTIAN